MASEGWFDDSLISSAWFDDQIEGWFDESLVSEGFNPNANINLVGAQAAGALGAVTNSTSSVVSISGVSCSGNAGNVVATTPAANISISGASSSSTIGAVEPSGNARLLGGDPAFGLVTLLMHMEGVDGGTTFTDVIGHTMTGNSVASVTSTAQARFGTTSLTGGAVNTQYGSEFYASSSNFTFECWVYPTSRTKVVQIVLVEGGLNNDPWQLRIETDGTLTYESFGHETNQSILHTVTTTSSTVPLNQWSHIAINANRLYIDGVLGATGIGSGYVPGSALTIRFGSADCFLDELRITKGESRYPASGFTPPTSSFLNVGPQLTSVQGAAALGTVVASSDSGSVASPSGVAGAGAAGTTTQSGNAAVPLTGSATNASVGTTTPSGSATLGAGDEYFSNVVLGLHMDGADAGTTFTDVKGNTVTAVGNAQTSTTVKKFGAASALFDGNGDYLSVPYSTNLNLIDGSDFTAECWVYPTGTNTENGRKIIRIGNDAYNGTTGLHLRLQVTGTSNKANVGWWDGVAGTAITGTTTIPNDTWTHLAFVRSGSNKYLFVNGVQEGGTSTATMTRPSTDQPILIGSGATGLRDWLGNIDDVRITKGVARYTSNFTPPSSAFLESVTPLNSVAGTGAVGTITASAGSNAAATPSGVSGSCAVGTVTLFGNASATPPSAAGTSSLGATTNSGSATLGSGDEYFNSVVLGLHMDGSDNGTTFTDITGKTVTRIGSTVTKTGTKKFGTASALFNGTTDGLTGTNTADFNFGTGDFTVELWVYLNNAAGNQNLIQQTPSSSYGGWNLLIISGTVYFTSANNSSSPWHNATSASALTSGQWYHIAVCRTGGNAVVYVNGVGGTSVANTDNITSTAPWRIGYDSVQTPQRWLNGYVDDVRVTKGVARYTTNFTPPAQAFADSLGTQLAGVSSSGVAGTVTASAAANATATPSGVSAASAIGSLTTTGTASTALSGASTTGSIGSAVSTGAATTNATSVVATSSLGTVVAVGNNPNASTSPNGVASTAALGSVAASTSATHTLNGASSTGVAGTTTQTGSVIRSVAGVAASSSAGSVSARADRAVIITGVSTTGASGVTTQTATASGTLAGVATSSAAGNATLSGTATSTLTGTAANAALGVVSAVGNAPNANVSVSGAVATSALGTLARSGTASTAVSSVQATAAANTVNAAGNAPNATVNLNGVGASAALGTAVQTGSAVKALSGVAGSCNTGVVTKTGGANTAASGVQTNAEIGSVVARGSASASLGSASASAIADNVAATAFVDAIKAIAGVSAASQVEALQVIGGTIDPITRDQYRAAIVALDITHDLIATLLNGDVTALDIRHDIQHTQLASDLSSTTKSSEIACKI